ncbi:hypothetical protein HNQ07_003957 [Deinococcus metalli]|uniref:Uncharacterized protein n=1 Tax=Deinococcus metalli TaxID=1141878 RepID=A0A7W8KID8_9DEIO|nr:hypothetical protein [Deinococcus metalli]MBB5378450.1 hypothetical protein [Deinococcus metalli]GHF57797.1 hypothetical protein GCM10017781_37500 [Deinococcus metalli]
MLGDQADSLRVSTDVLTAHVARRGTVDPVYTSGASTPGVVPGSIMSGLLDTNRQFLRRVKALLKRWPPGEVTAKSVLFAVEMEVARRVRVLVEATCGGPDSSSAHDPLPPPH